MSELLTFQPPQFIVKATAKPPSEASLDGSSAGKQAVMREVQRKLKDTDAQDDGEAETVEKAGHKYISRERKGNRWVYTYPDDATQAAPATPRAEAAEHTAEHKKAEYAFARDSAVQNKGEDLLGSARHKRNRWKGLEAAEAEGSADELVNRKTLLDASGLNLKSSISDENPYTAVFSHLVLQRFPDAPESQAGEGAAARALYVEAFEGIERIIESFDASTTQEDARDQVARYVSLCIRNQRSQGQRDLANQFAGYFNRNLRGGNTKTSASGAANHLQYHTGDKTFFRAVDGDWKHVTEPGKSTEEKKAIAESIIDGSSVDKALGNAVKKKAKEDYAPKPADLYIGKAERIGPSVADTATHDAQEKLLIDKMGMRGVQFGNSVTDDERAHHLRETALAFHDLATATGLPEEMASFNGKLGIAIGARGHGTALAHYEPSTKVINLTRKNGVGSLAHEWGHFFDNVLGSLTGSGKFLTDSARFASSRGHFGNDAREDMAPSQQMLAAMAQVFNNPAMQSFRRRLRNEPDWYKMSPKQREYWGSTIEVWARTFETYVGHKLNEKGQKNTYLAGVKPHPYWPNPEEIAAIAPDIDAVFEHFKNSEYLHKALRWMAQANPAADVLGEYLSKGNKPLGAAFSHARKVAKENGGGKKKQKQVANRYLNSHGDKPIGKSTSLERGMLACDILGDYLEKAGKGAGSRGGKIKKILPNGKAVYAGRDAEHASYEGFGAKDHEAASDFHAEIARRHVANKNDTTRSAKERSDSENGRQRHSSRSFRHRLHARLMSESHEHVIKQAQEHRAIADKNPDDQTAQAKAEYHEHRAKQTKAMFDGSPTHAPNGARYNDTDEGYKSMEYRSDFSGADVIEAYLAKGGEGSRGGRILGHTRSGKPIYAYGQQTKGYTRQDHADAGEAHHTQASKHEKMALNDGDDGHHLDMAGMHTDIGDEHFRKETSKKSMDGIGHSASDVLGAYLAKGGEGSRGGKIIGHTAGGHPIYSSTGHGYRSAHFKTEYAGTQRTDKYLKGRETKQRNAVIANHPQFTAQDHRDAAEAHRAHGGYEGKTGTIARAHANAADHLEAKANKPVRGKAGLTSVRNYSDTDEGYYGKSLDDDDDFAKSDYSAADVLGAYLAKGGGPGSRGGKVIGKTASGRPIYAANKQVYGGMNSGVDHAEHVKSRYPEYTAQDHADASKTHRDAAEKLDSKPATASSFGTYARHVDAMRGHHAAALKMNGGEHPIPFATKKSMDAGYGDNEQSFADTQNNNPDMLLVRPVDDVQHSVLNDAIAASWPGRPFMASAADTFCAMDRANRNGQ